MSNKLYNQLGNAAKRALEHKPGNDENGEEYGESSFGGFGDYMRRKKLKLQNQDEEIRKEIKDEPQIFKGMVIHINGYTKPPREDLHHLIVKHGGVYKQYLEGKTFVTHIIASNLTPKKRVEFERYKVIRPEWIVDCVKAGKALPWTQYRLIDRSSQTTIGFTPKSVDGYKAVSSRDEQVVYGGGGLKQELSQESSSYPTPPEMKSMNLEAPGSDAKSEEAALTETRPDAMDSQEEIPSDLSPIEISPTNPVATLSPPSVDIPSTLSPIELPSPAAPARQISPVNPPQEELMVIDSPTRSSPKPEQSNEIQPSHIVNQAPSDAQPGFAFQQPKLVPIEDKAAAHNAAFLQANPSLRSSTVLNPDFIRSYFDQSRLHHLSTWKADLKTQMQQLASQTPRRNKKTGDDRWIMHVDFDCFFCSVSLLSRPDLKDKPVCVGHGGGRSGEIASCNYPARKFGIHNGMFMGRALDLCKDLVCLPYDFPAYEKASRDFYHILLSVGADATQAVSVDEALLDVSSICNSAPEDLAQSIRDRVREKTQCDVSIGIGQNILLAKVALRKAKPAGQYYLKTEDAQEFMQNLDVQDLPGVGWKLSEKLEEVMGIRTVGEVRTKSMNELKEKFGPKTGERLYEFARGIDHTEVGEIVQRMSVSVEVNWGVRFETAEQVDKFLVSLATELSSRLIKESFTGTHLMLKVMRRAADAPLDPPKHLGHGKCDTFNKSVQMGVATNNPEILGRETITMMKSLRIPPGDLRGIGLQMGKLEKVGEVKLEMGQKKLDFSKAPKADIQAQSPRLPAQKSPPVQQNTAPALSQTPMKPTQFIAPTQIDPEVLANLPEDIRARIISRKPVPVQSSQIDEEVLRELPLSIQEELRQAYKKPVMRTTPKRPSPRKTKSVLSMVGQSKLPLSSPEALDQSVLAELPSPLRQEVIANAQREQALARAAKARHLTWAAEKAVRERKVSRSVTIPDPPPKPTFQTVSELPELRDLISRWFKEFRDEGPAEEDVELLGVYLRKVVLIEKDLRKAEAVVKWFRSCCQEPGAAQDEWWASGSRLMEHVNDACMERGVAKIDFDTRSL